MAAAGTVEFWKYWEGRIVDDAFPLLRCLGSGATSAVFLTEAAGEKGRRAALRLVRANAPGGETQLSRWQRASRLSHPHLIRLLNMGRCQLDAAAMLYLVMEYADENLSQILPDRSLTEAETSQMLAPVIGALRYIHGQGLMHGHLKPANIMAVEDQVKISSDGLWSIGGRAEHRTTSSPYDSPEIATRGMSPAGDVWSLGVTLVEVLTKRPGAVVPEGISPRLAGVIGHCLEPDPQRRWDLDRIAQSLGEPAQFIGPKKSSKWRYILPAAALVGLAAVAMLMFRSAPVTHSEVPPPPPVVQVQPEKPPPEIVRPEKKIARPAKSQVETKPQASGEILDEVMPAVTQHAQATVRGKFMVDVRVHVDPSGSVLDAKFDQHGPSRYFAESSLAAARKWRFRSSDAPQDWILHFRFDKSGVTVVPAHVSP